MFLTRPDRKKLSDLQLVESSRSGDREAVGVLFDRYAHLLIGVGLKYLKDKERSKDLVMELFGDLEKLISDHEIHSFKSWLHTVMRNRCLLALRADKKMKNVPLNESVTEASEEDDATTLRESSLQQLEQAIEQLKEGQRQCIKLFYIEKHSYQTVAERTGLSIEKVRSNLQNGRRNLRISLENHADQHRT
jgi:RNA polymerase sigma-70 factor (ECF subfamily)